ncbi:MAG: transposase [Bacillota bacterium]|nr:transposase [Bacillota bacterium]
MNDLLQGKRLNYLRRPNGTTYVYEVLDRYWDKEKKQARTRQRCIGKLDPQTGDFIPSKRFSQQQKAPPDPSCRARTVIAGPGLLFRHLDQQIGLSDCLQEAAPRIWAEILSLAACLLASGGALSDADIWLSQHESWLDGPLTGGEISNLLKEITADVRQAFFRQWGTLDGERLCYLTSSVSSWQELKECLRYACDEFPQIYLATIYAKDKLLPVSYRELPGPITDVTALRNLLSTFDLPRTSGVHVVLDQAFYSQENIEQLCESRQPFTLALPADLGWVEDLIDQYRDRVDGPDGLNFIDGQPIYCLAVPYPWGEAGRSCWAHIFYDADQMVQDRQNYDCYILDLEEELLGGQLVKEHLKDYERYFIVRETPVRGRTVKRNSEAITAGRRQYAGFSVLLSSVLKDPLEAFRIYREKELVESCFDNLKNESDMSVLRIHGSVGMSSRSFIQFIAMILLAQLRKRMFETGLSKSYTDRRLIRELESLIRIEYPGSGKGELGRLSEQQREIFETLGIAADGQP